VRSSMPSASVRDRARRTSPCPVRPQCDGVVGMGVLSSADSWVQGVADDGIQRREIRLHGTDLKRLVAEAKPQCPWAVLVCTSSWSR
jgi:hypothetical protein